VHCWKPLSWPFVPKTKPPEKTLKKNLCYELILCLKHYDVFWSRFWLMSACLLGRTSFETSFGLLSALPRPPPTPSPPTFHIPMCLICYSPASSRLICYILASSPQSLLFLSF
jgi:hypothetical protein